MPPPVAERPPANPSILVKFANLFPVIGPGLNSRLHLLYIGIGDDDGLLEGWQAARKVFEEKVSGIAGSSFRSTGTTEVRGA